ncbi:mediator complex, subunit Med22 [Bisporella sp. PMI_857]|nr:mediator complex, subunit Med22 [Bisporella sp. PMI_857]
MEVSQPSSASLLDRKDKNVAALMTHFKELINLASMPTEDSSPMETAAAQALKMEMHTNGLVQAAENLLQLTREMKELWLAGPLSTFGEEQKGSDMAEDATKVGNLVQGVLSQVAKLQAEPVSLS